MRGEMALQLLCSPSLSSPSSLPMAITATPISKLQRKFFDLQAKSFNGVRICTHFRVQERGTLIVRASSDVDGVSSVGNEPGGTEPGGNEPEPEPKEEKTVSVEDLPLESKEMQLKLKKEMLLAQRLKMKLAKKIRLRRKRLVRKRRLRKKGRWPPSKMKKNKNV